MKIHLCHRVTFPSPHIQPQKEAFCCSDAGETPLSPRLKREHWEIKQDLHGFNIDIATKILQCKFPCAFLVLRGKTNPVKAEGN